jgi:hypothetical protein
MKSRWSIEFSREEAQASNGRTAEEFDDFESMMLRALRLMPDNDNLQMVIHAPHYATDKQREEIQSRGFQSLYP